MSASQPVSLLRRLILLTTTLFVGLSLAAPAHGLKAVEPFAAYQPQVSCDPAAKPGVLAFRSLVQRKFGGSDLGIARSCSTGGSSEHKEGRAWDYGLNWYKKADRKRANATITWLTEPVAGDPARRAKRLGVMYMIWNNKIWSAYRASDGWRPYTGASPHRDHIHFSFTWNGAMKNTSWWTGRVMPFDYGPCQRWVGELAPKWKKPRLKPCPEPIRRPVANQKGIYLAQSGETVRRVARFFDLTGRQVRVWNGFPRRGKIELYVGQRVRVVKPDTIPPITQPTPDPAPEPEPAPEPGTDRDDWWNHDETADRPEEDLADARYYTVQDGDTLWRIAYTHRVSLEQVMWWNNLTDFTIEPGQRLRVG